MGKMANETMRKFGYPGSLIRDFEHWVVLLRPGQVTLGSLVLAAKSDAMAFGALPVGAHAELAQITAEIEATLKTEIGYDRINYLMLMMVDPNVHFHVFPRYEGSRAFEGATIEDRGWPGPPDLKSAIALPQPASGLFLNRLMQNWLTNC
jgi:diadenosine tetraphosphate (Ap4A) HIT family hydrolase